MKNLQDLFIEPLNKVHNKAGFCCGLKSLDSYIQKQAGQDIKRNISRVFVATLADDPEYIMGYYSLSTLSISLNQLPEKLRKKLPRHPIPAALIGRLAVSKKVQGRGIGKLLLANAIKKTIAVSDQIAIYAMIVDAINEEAKAFYEQYGFVSLSDDNSLRLFLPLKAF